MPEPFAVDPRIGGRERNQRVDALIGAIADTQHGVVSRLQLLIAGVTKHQIDLRVEQRRLRVVHRGVYAVGHRALSQEGIWMAAVLAGGEAAVLSHWSAASLARLRQGRGPRSHITCSRRRRSSESIAFHFGELQDDEVTVENGIPITTPARTVLDLAATVNTPSLTRMVAAIRPTAGASLAELLDRYPRKPGSAKLRAVVAKPIAFTRSDLEADYLERFERAGVARPQVNAVIQGHEVDFVWAEHGVVAELDTYMTHGSRDAFVRDRERDRKLAAAGWRVVRLTDEDDGIEDLSRALAATAGGSPSRPAAA